jgi:hypothetical protein
MRPLGLPLFVLTLAAASAPVAAQQAGGAMRTEPGTIQGVGGRAAAGVIHVVGNTMGSQKIHFTSEFKVDASTTLHAVLSSDLMAGGGSADLGPIASAGDQLISVPANVDVAAFATLLVYDSGTRTVVAATILPNAKGQAYRGMKDSTMKRTY